MIGDVEDYLVRTVELGFIEALVPLRPLGETFGAELLDLASHRVDILDQHSEMVDAAEVESRPLVPAKMQHRETQGAITKEHTVRFFRIVTLFDPADLGEIERLLLELRCGKRIFRSKCDMAKRGHADSRLGGKNSRCRVFGP